MLDYEWGNPSGMMQLSGEEPQPHHSSEQAHHSFIDHYHHHHHQTQSFSDHQTLFLANSHHQNHDLSPANTTPALFPQSYGSGQQPLQALYDPRAFHGAAPYASMLSLDTASTQYMVVPKAEEAGIGSSRIGLNLGGRTYFASSEDDFVSRLYRRRPMELSSANSPRCQAEGCNADLSHAKHYHRRHKVCEFHSKASTVIAAGLTQRFCQQCSRFHLLSEFDNGKRSCRKRLADHNRRRRKTQQQPNLDNPKPISSSSQLEIAAGTNPSSDHSIPRSPPDSGAQSSSSVTIALSPPRILSLDCFRQRSTYQTTPSSSSSGSLFFSSG